mmetsp:Transcript_15536/g.34284  ORF Transcript_15536/g.34284 Transcript_15536/m.34284 type:complete len:210 (+) Transcript_15536:960-1589(+)
MLYLSPARAEGGLQSVQAWCLPCCNHLLERLWALEAGASTEATRPTETCQYHPLPWPPSAVHYYEQGCPTQLQSERQAFAAYCRTLMMELDHGHSSDPSHPPISPAKVRLGCACRRRCESLRSPHDHPNHHRSCANHRHRYPDHGRPAHGLPRLTLPHPDCTTRRQRCHAPVRCPQGAALFAPHSPRRQPHTPPTPDLRRRQPRQDCQH